MTKAAFWTKSQSSVLLFESFGANFLSKDFNRSTLRTVISVRSGINVLVGKFSINNKRTVWNSHTDGKILLLKLQF